MADIISQKREKAQKRKFLKRTAFTISLLLLFQNNKSEKAFYTLQRSALFKDDPVPWQGPTMATIDGRGKYKIPRNISISILLTMIIFSLILLQY